MAWSRTHTECKNCHTTTHPHKGRGLCRPCYYKQYPRKNTTYQDGVQDAVYAYNKHVFEPQGGTTWLRGDTVYVQAGGVTVKFKTSLDIR